jgi:hypothetical protein
MVTFPKDKYQERVMIILLSGKAGSGKTTVANFMIDGLPQSKVAGIAPFALGIKTVANLIGWDNQKDEKGRRLLQQFGNAGREFHKDIWIEFTMNALQGSDIPFDVIIMDDWRFPNEYRWFVDRADDYGVYTVRVVRDEYLLLNPEDTDVSETALPDDPEYYDFNIINKNLDLDELRAHSRFVLQSMIDKEYSLQEV